VYTLTMNILMIGDVLGKSGPGSVLQETFAYG
jgi:hypothetical protein